MDTGNTKINIKKKLVQRKISMHNGKNFPKLIISTNTEVDQDFVIQTKSSSS